MASADQYAEWIVNNADKKGTPDFETVVQAYQEALVEERLQAQQAQQPQQPTAAGFDSAAQADPEAALVEGAPESKYGLGKGLLGLGETALTMGTGLASSAAGGLAGLASMPFVGVREGADIMQKVQEAGTYQPKTDVGTEMLSTVAKPFQILGEGQKYVGNVVQEATGSPVLGALTETAPDIVGTLFGLRALKTMKPGTQLKQGGVPTRELMDALNKHNIVYDDLSPAAKQAIPDVAPQSKLLGRDLTPKVVEDAIIKEVQAGGRQQGLAPYRVNATQKLVSDKLAEEAIKQQFAPGDVQMIKTTTPETQAKMLKMLRNREAIAANSANDINLRPSNIVGDAAAERLKFIARQSQQARKQLHQIANTKLKGKQFDPAPVEQVFMSKIEDLGIRFKMVDGKPAVSYEGSIIQADKASQRAINDLVKLMADSTNGPVDALRAHNLKRQIDALIDWHKKPQMGLTAEGKAVLKDVRGALNRSLRQADPDYARVNDTISRSLQLFDELDNATASKITVSKTLQDARGMGTELRKLFSNYQTRQDLDTAIRSMDELAKEFARTSNVRDVGEYLGESANFFSPTFNDSIFDLARFANVLDDKFGTVAKTSLEGVSERAVKHGMRAAQQGVTSASVQGLSEIALDKLRKMRNIDDYHAYRSMEELLNKGRK